MATTAIDVAAEAATVATPTKVLARNLVLEREILIHKLMDQFLKLNPPRFTGAEDPETTSLWIQDLKKAFALMMCTEAEKVVLVVYQLLCNVNTWWRAARGTVFLEVVVPM